MSEPYIPNARDAVIAYFGVHVAHYTHVDSEGRTTGTSEARVYRCFCVRCNDVSPLADAARVYGDLYVSDEYAGASHDDAGEYCDACGVTLLDLSRACQREHDEQQARFARGPITHVVEMGMVGQIRCRIY